MIRVAINIRMSVITVMAAREFHSVFRVYFVVITNKVMMMMMMIWFLLFAQS